MFIHLRAADDTIPVEVDSPDPKLARSCWFAGEIASNAAHQYWAGTVAMYKMLKEIPGVHVSVVRYGWPKESDDIFNNARGHRRYMEGGEGGAVHPLSTAGRLELLQKLLEQRHRPGDAA